MPGPKDRTLPQYELQRQLGRGGMGVVYQAFDRKHGRSVALKTLLSESDPDSLALFRRELAVLSQISHPNIVGVYDSGEIEENGQSKPFFVMPLLRGQTLQELLDKSGQSLSLNRLTDIVIQTCKGLQAAHESGLIHRDLKPSNIFILEDYSVNIIDFGVAHLVNLHTTVGLKGTLYYMAPEQLSRKALSPGIDIWALGVVCYQALAGRRPFEGRTERELTTAILNHTPPLVSDVNPSVSQSVSLVIHKALAKLPTHRFLSAVDFADCMQKALRNEPIEYFNPVRIQPRLERARKAAAEGDHEYANEILSGLESEGFTSPEIGALRRTIQEEGRQKTIRTLLETARRRLREEEYQLALQKLQELGELDPENAEAAALKRQIEEKRSSSQLDDWLKIARQHLESRSFDHARAAVEGVLRTRPAEARAHKLRDEIAQLEQEHKKLTQEKAKLFDAAVAARQRGDLDAALARLEKVLELERVAPDATNPARGDSYRQVFDEVRSEQQALNSALERARNHLAKEEFDSALAVCDEWLKRYPSNVMLHALELEVLELRKRDQSGFIARVRRAVDQESDLGRRVRLLKEALDRYPGEPSLVSTLEIMERRHDLVQRLVTSARSLEEHGQFAEALSQWESLRTIHPGFPGLEIELERLQHRHQEQGRTEARSRWIDEIERALKLSDPPQALELCRRALEEFPEDSELLVLERHAAGGIARREEALRLLEEGKTLRQEGKNDEALTAFRQAYALDEQQPALRSAFLELLLKLAISMRDTNLLAAEPLIEEALKIDASNVQARSLRTLVLDRKYNQFVNELLAASREKEAEGDLECAIAQVDKILARYPQDARALRRKSQLQSPYAEEPRTPPREVEAPHAREKEPVREQEPVRLREPEPIQPQQREVSVQPSSLFAPFESLQVGRPEVKSEVYPELEPPKEQPVRAAEPKPAPKPKPEAPKAAQPTPDEPDPAQHRPAPRRVSEGTGLRPVVLPPPVAKRSTTRDPEPEPSRARRIVVASSLVLLLLAGFLAFWFLPREKPTDPDEVLKKKHEQALIRSRQLHISAGFENGTIALDKNSPIKLNPGRHTLENLEPGKHSVTISRDNIKATLEFEISPGKAPQILHVPARRGLHVAAVSSVPGKTSIFTTFADLKVLVDGKSIGQLDDGRIDLETLSDGHHQFVFGEGPDARPIVIEIAEQPSLALGLIADKALVNPHTGGNTPSQPSERVVQINSTPTEANIIVDDDPLLTCTTPCELPLKRGRHVVVFTKESYRMQPKIIVVPELLEAFATLDPITGTLTVSTKPAGATITIDDVKRPELTNAIIKLPAGIHRVVLSLAGHPSHEEFVEIQDSIITRLPHDFTGSAPTPDR